MTDVSTTKRKAMSPTRRLRIFEAHKGICITCSQPIRAADKWFIEHIRALELGGEDTDANCAPAHVACKAVKDADDHHRAAKAKRAKQRHLGITAAKQPIPSRGFAKRPRAHEGRQPVPQPPLFKKDHVDGF